MSYANAPAETNYRAVARKNYNRGERLKGGSTGAEGKRTTDEVGSF